LDRLNNCNTPTKSEISIQSTPNKLETQFNQSKRQRNSDKKEEFDSSEFDHHYPEENCSRFRKDFVEIDVVGDGSYGIVRKVRSRMESCFYAIKESKNQFRGVNEKDRAVKEVLALAALSTADGNPHIVRYFDSWIEDKKLFIKTELCDSNLSFYIKKYLEKETSISKIEELAIDILRQVLDGLKCLHSHNMAHLDIKPDNIFVKGDVYKIGDFGHVVMISKKDKINDQNQFLSEIEDGDPKYIAREILHENHDNLQKADIFSLGASIYEIFMQRDLPPNGEEWTNIRDGKLDANTLSKISTNMRELLEIMMHPDPTQRPSAKDLLETGGPGKILSSNYNNFTITSISEKEEEINRLKKELELLRSMKNNGYN